MPERSESNLNVIAQRHYSWIEGVGWHNKTPLECLALIAGAVGEAVNEYECRGAQPTAKLGEELADIILRSLDLMVSCGFDPEAEVKAKMESNEERGNRGRLL